MTSSLSLLREPRSRPAGLPDCPGSQRLEGMCAGTVLLFCKCMMALLIRQSARSQRKVDRLLLVVRALRKLRRDYPRDAHVFVSERGGPISPIGFHRLIQRVGEAAKMPFPIHPHMLRHACGFKLANDGHDTRALQHYLGHKNIQHTVRYTEMAPDRFKDFWRN